MSRFGRFDFDENQPEIITALELAGAKVKRLDAYGFPSDLLVGWRRRLFILEVKNPATVSKVHQRQPEKSLTRAERDFFELFAGFPIFIVFTPEEALEAIGISG